MTVSIRIAKNVYGGDGLGRLGDGRVCFVPGAFAGEMVKAEITSEHRRFVNARLVDVIEPSPSRILAGETIPGMVYAGIDYETELKYKQEQLENFLWKVDSSLLDVQAIGAPETLHYRNKVVYHIEKADNRWVMGYREEPSNRVVDVVHDPLAVPAINAALPGIRSDVLTLLTQGSRVVRRDSARIGNVTIRWTKNDGVKWWLGDAPKDLELHEESCGFLFRVPADGFWQVNSQVAEMLVKMVREACLADIHAAPYVLDLYCGVGVFGLTMAKACPEDVPLRLTGIESGQSAIRAAKKNAEAFGVKAHFFAERVGGNLGRIRIGRQSTVILDPPRGGLESNVAPWLAKHAVPRIMYVSCDPATLTRDLSALAKSYRIRRVRLFDMFPRTARFETFVELEIRK